MDRHQMIWRTGPLAELTTDMGLPPDFSLKHGHKCIVAAFSDAKPVPDRVMTTGGFQLLVDPIEVLLHQAPPRPGLARDCNDGPPRHNSASPQAIARFESDAGRFPAQATRIIVSFGKAWHGALGIQRRMPRARVCRASRRRRRIPQHHVTFESPGQTVCWQQLGRYRHSCL